jgi:hypothetical protein
MNSPQLPNRYAAEEAAEDDRRRAEAVQTEEAERRMRTIPDLLQTFHTDISTEKKKLERMSAQIGVNTRQLSFDIELLRQQLQTAHPTVRDRVDGLDRIVVTLNDLARRLMQQAERLEGNMEGFVSQCILFHMRGQPQATPFPTENALDTNVPGLLIDNPSLPPHQVQLPAVALTAVPLALFSRPKQ